ncbi:MAG TPA: hypothetical protein VGE74_26490 [Gemmata sp.]
MTFAVLAGHPKLARSVGMDVWNVPELNQQLDAATNESNRLTCEGDVVLRRIAVKETIIKEMLAGRASLADATARFAEMNVNRPQAQEAVRHMYAGATDQEKTARNVIAFAAARVSAAEREALSRRLEAELQQMIAASSAH